MRLTTFAVPVVLAFSSMACFTTGHDYKLNRDKAELFAYPQNRDGIPSFMVELEIVIFASQTEEFPEIYEAFKQAVDTWCSKTPVKITIYTQDIRNPHPFFGPVVFSGNPRIIEVHMADIQSAAYGYQRSSSTVGAWEPDRHRLLLDDVLEEYPDVALAVALHEMGHMFGLPHIVNDDQLAYTGYIVLDEGAEHYTMHPRVVVGQSQSELSELEISLASNYIKHMLTVPAIFFSHRECFLNLLDKGAK